MSKEILFRGKRINSGEWVYGYLARFRNFANEVYTSIIQINDYETQECSIQDNTCVIPETVGQYTGLNDKNGKKIFEGDIVEFTDKFTHKRGRAEIVFEAFKWKYSGCYYGGNPIVWLCIEDTSVEYEVIGNIHDNPELLEVEE